MAGHIFAVVLYDGHCILRLMAETAGMVVAGGLRRAPVTLCLPVALRLIVLNRRRTASCPLVPTLLGLFTTVFVEKPRRDL